MQWFDRHLFSWNAKARIGISKHRLSFQRVMLISYRYVKVGRQFTKVKKFLFCFVLCLMKKFTAYLQTHGNNITEKEKIMMQKGKTE